MQKPRRIVIVAVVALVVVAGLALAVRVLLGGDHIKAAVEAQASAALGSPVTIAAAVPRLLPRVGLDLTGITIGATREVTVDRARLTTGFRALLRGRRAGRSRGHGGQQKQKGQAGPDMMKHDWLPPLPNPNAAQA